MCDPYGEYLFHKMSWSSGLTRRTVQKSPTEFCRMQFKTNLYGSSEKSSKIGSKHVIPELISESSANVRMGNLCDTPIIKKINCYEMVHKWMHKLNEPVAN